MPHGVPAAPAATLVHGGTRRGCRTPAPGSPPPAAASPQLPFVVSWHSLTFMVTKDPRARGKEPGRSEGSLDIPLSLPCAEPPQRRSVPLPAAPGARRAVGAVDSPPSPQTPSPLPAAAALPRLLALRPPSLGRGRSCCLHSVLRAVSLRRLGAFGGEGERFSRPLGLSGKRGPLRCTAPSLGSVTPRGAAWRTWECCGSSAGRERPQLGG